VHQALGFFSRILESFSLWDRRFESILTVIISTAVLVLLTKAMFAIRYGVSSLYRKYAAFSILSSCALLLGDALDNQRWEASASLRLRDLTSLYHVTHRIFASSHLAFRRISNALIVTLYHNSSRLGHTCLLTIRCFSNGRLVRRATFTSDQLAIRRCSLSIPPNSLSSGNHNHS